MKRWIFCKQNYIEIGDFKFMIYKPFTYFPYEMSEQEDIYVYNMDILSEWLNNIDVTKEIINLLRDRDTVSSVTTIQRHWYYDFKGLMINRNQFSIDTGAV